MMRPSNRRTDLAGKQPAIGCGIVAAAAVKFGGAETSGATAPNDHVCAAPDGRMRGSRYRSASRRDSLPAISDWIITATVVEVSAAVSSAHTIMRLPVHTAL